MMEIEIPKIINFHKIKWEKEQKNNINIKKYQQKENEEIEKISKERKKAIFEKERKIRTKKMYKDNIKKGKDYEKFISEYYKKAGYKVKEYGLENGRKDKGIDIIIMKNKEITLIQCKNWKINSTRKINHIRIKEFIGNCSTFLEKNQNKHKNYKIKKLYIVSNDILDNSAKKFIKENNDILDYKIIPYINN